MGSFMNKLPIISGKEIVKTLHKIGFLVVHQKGSHIKLKKKVNERELIVIVPLHKEVKRGVLLNMLKQSELSKEDFLKLL